MSINARTQAWSRQNFIQGALGSGIEIWAHRDSGYSKRTLENAQCDVTAAIAADYSTGGERLTKNMARDRYIPLPLFLDEDVAGERLGALMLSKNAKTLNIAGNGIHTLGKKNWTQDAVDLWLFKCLAAALSIHRPEWIQSGGQTGLDLSGAICAAHLGVPALILLPAGFKQRGADGVDRVQDPVALLAEIEHRAALLPPFSKPTAAPLSFGPKTS